MECRTLLYINDLADVDGLLYSNNDHKSYITKPGPGVNVDKKNEGSAPQFI